MPPTKPQSITPPTPPITDAAVEDLAEKVKEKAIQMAAEAIAARILDKVGRDAQVRKMRQESVARARQALAAKGKGAAPAPATGPIQTEMTKIGAGAKPPRIRKGGAKGQQPAATASTAGAPAPA